MPWLGTQVTAALLPTGVLFVTAINTQNKSFVEVGGTNLSCMSFRTL